MKIVFLGTGEAFDEEFLNNSSLVQFKKTNLLLDCGLTTPFQLWKYNEDQNLLDAVFISHCHADHYLGLPSLLVRMWEEKRTRPLSIICLKGNKKKIRNLMELAYKGFAKRFLFEIIFIEVKPKESVIFNDLGLTFAKTEHSLDNLAVRVENESKALCYSGDGAFNQKTENLCLNSDFAILEAYLYDQKVLGHGNVTGVIKMAERNNIKAVALTHINRELRRKGFPALSEKVKILIPKPFDELEI